MDSIDIQLSEEHNHSIVSLINKIVAKSPLLCGLSADSVVFLRLVSVISLIETTLCSGHHVSLKRNSTHSESVRVIKEWLNQYYDHHFVTRLCRRRDHRIHSHTTDDSDPLNGHTEGIDMKCGTNGDNNEDNSASDEYSAEDVDRDMGLMSLSVLLIAHKLRQSLPRINAYFSPEWQTLSEFDVRLNGVINFDNLLNLIQNELCIKRQQLEVTKSKVLSLQSIINSRDVSQNALKKTQLDCRSNLFAEYEDNDCDQMLGEEDMGDTASVDSNRSPVFMDHLSDDDYEPKHKSQKMVKSSATRKRGSVVAKSGRGRGRSSKLSLSPIRVTPQTTRGGRSRGRPSKVTKSEEFIYEDEINETLDRTVGEFVCETCGKEFEKEYRLVRHKFTHLGHKQFLCDFPDCGQSFDLKYKLREHKSEHNGGDTFDYSGDDSTVAANSGHYLECEWADCGMGFTSRRELTQHEHEMHANRSQSKYSCDWPQCRHIFESKIEWRKHVRTHGKITPTDCGYPGCHLSFYKLEALENHRKIHETFTIEELV